MAKDKTIKNKVYERADDGIRTCDLRVTSALLYQLSYIGLLGKYGAKLMVFPESCIGQS